MGTRHRPRTKVSKNNSAQTVNEFSQLLEIVQNLKNRVEAQQMQLDIQREQIAELTEQLYGTTERPEDKAA